MRGAQWRSNGGIRLFEQLNSQSDQVLLFSTIQDGRLGPSTSGICEVAMSGHSAMPAAVVSEGRQAWKAYR
jgi:hypothetical protein